MNDGNLERYLSDDVVSYYEKQNDLQPCETYIFDRFVQQGLSILDIGVGGGRTTPYLAKGARRYLGADYSEGMVQACRRRFPLLDFRLCDATDMSQFTDCEFDVVVFSFNGIDSIPTDEGRTRCLAEVARILKHDGVFIFSSHNARTLGLWPQLAQANPLQIIWRILRALWKSIVISRRTQANGVYQAGEGYIHDPVHGGLKTYVSTPETIRSQIEAAGLKLVETVGGHYPNVTSAALTPWYYYACKKLGAA
jgi:SAM-dependent methyltransferase